MSQGEIIHGDIAIRSNSEANVRRFVQVLLESVGPSRLTFEEKLEQDEAGDWLVYGELSVYVPGPVPPDWRKRT